MWISHNKLERQCGYHTINWRDNVEKAMKPTGLLQRDGKPEGCEVRATVNPIYLNGSAQYVRVKQLVM
jgi:hypothetical protein